MSTILQTERLVLRPISMDDLDDLHQIFGDPVAMEHYPGTRTREELIPLVERSMGYFEKDGTGFYSMNHRETDEWIGQCGLLWQEVDESLELEIGYHCKVKYWRRGYTSEAARRLRDFAFEELGRDHVISLIKPENVASAGVAKKMGMSIWKNADFKGFHVNVWRLLREDWK